MALTRLTAPDDPAVANSDWTDLLAQITALYLGANGPIIRFASDNILKGTVLQIGGTVYLADADTAISGTTSAYVKITPAGASASAAYVANLSGVTWSQVFNGWYDGSGNLYIFDEAYAVSDGEISEAHASSIMLSSDGTVTAPIEFSNGINPSGGVIENSETIHRHVYEIGAWDMDSTATKDVAISESLSAIAGITATLTRDDNATTVPIYWGGSEASILLVNTSVGVRLSRDTSGYFDNADWSSTSVNRGYVMITYVD